MVLTGGKQGNFEQPYCPGSPIFNPLLDSLLAEFGGGSWSNCGSRSLNRKPSEAKNGQL